ncbi:MAG: hypothetical protein VB055_05470 [Oscillospiraceae bacterium]|nr:hypothetical protein [Oscillospiraceae bacterium]
MKKIKVGYLPLYIKLYDDSNAHYRDPMVNYMNMMVGMIESQGIEVVMADEVCRIKEEFDRAAKKFNDADVDAVITQHLAYSPSLESIGALLSLKAPIVVFDTTPDYELLKVANYEGRISANHGIHGVQDMCNLLKRNGRKYYLCVGHALHSEVVSEVVSMCRAAAAAKAFQTARIGSVGGSFTGMGDFLISDERYKNDIGAEVKYMTPEVVKTYLAEVTGEEIDAEIKRDGEKYTVEVKGMAEYRAVAKSGLAVRKWMEAEHLTACTVNFLTLDICGLPKMPFPECCKIMERGQGYAGEGDVLTAGLVGSLFRIYPNTCFTEMFCPDWEKNVILLSHMGESNPNLAEWKPLITDMDFNYNSCGNTVGMYTCYRPGKVVFVNLAPMEDHFHLILTEAELLRAGLERGAYRDSTQGWLKPCKPLPQFLKEFSLAGGTHHSALVYDGNIEEIRAFGEMMGFEVIVIQ